MDEKRYSILYGIEDEDPMDWHIIDNKDDSIIYPGNGHAVVSLLNCYEKNLSLIIKKCTELSLRNVDLVEKNGKIMQENKRIQEQLNSIPPKIREVWIDDIK